MMTVKELRDALEGFDDNLEVLTKKAELFGNVAYVNTVKPDSYGCFGTAVLCVLLTDEYEEEEEE